MNNAYRLVRIVTRSQIPTSSVLVLRTQFPPPVTGGLTFPVYWRVALGFGTVPAQPTNPLPVLQFEGSEVWSGLRGKLDGPNGYISPDWSRWRLVPQPNPQITHFKLWCSWDSNLLPTITQIT